MSSGKNRASSAHQSDGDLFRTSVMTVAETCRRLDLCAYTLLRQVFEQGIRGEAVTIRLPIDHIHSIPAFHQIEKKAAGSTPVNRYAGNYDALGKE